jgi:two-component system, NtrC family, sensor kinase
MYDLVSFSKSDATECGTVLRSLCSGVAGVEDAGDKIVRQLYEQLGDKQSGRKVCALVRFYKTQAYGELDQELQKFADGILGRPPDVKAVKCLTLLGTVGDKAEWNSRKNSNGHKAIPLPSEKVIAQIPMISQLIKQFGLEASSVIKPDPLLLVDLHQKTYNMFHVPDAKGSPYIPAQQDFVIPMGIESVVGFGGILSSGNLFVVIMFCKVSVPRETADNFKSLALDVKAVVEPLEAKKASAA